MNKAIQEIIRFQTDRGLDKKDFSTLNEQSSIVEELLELEGYGVSKEDRPKLKKEFTTFKDALVKKTIAKRANQTKHFIIDALCDVVVFAVGAMLKLGYDPEKALLETAKEINSREGSMVDGKFEKDLSDNAQAKWYKADYHSALKVS